MRLCSALALALSLVAQVPLVRASRRRGSGCCIGLRHLFELGWLGHVNYLRCGFKTALASCVALRG
jgi:hypothetical protein